MAVRAAKRPADPTPAVGVELAPCGASSRLGQLSGLEAELAALSSLSLADLRRRWQSATDKPVPRVRRTLLQLALAWELQAALHGGLPRRTEQRLAYLAGRDAPDQVAAPGMRLVREWGGELHTVVIDAEGRVCWKGQTWRSLSEVARAITGTRWSGPAFFGLKQKGERA